LLGYPDQALKWSREALALAQESKHPVSMAVVWIVNTLLYQFLHEVAIVQQQTEALTSLSSEQGISLALSGGAHAGRGWVLVEQGRAEEGMMQLRQDLAASQAAGANLWRTHGLALLAEAYAKAGQVEEGLATLTEALALVDKTGERFYEAELYRLKGELLLAQAEQRAKSKK
jgi:tetratricopeptide (TPR) repeat protein